MDQEKLNFIGHLQTKNLSNSTIKEYLIYYNLLLKRKNFDQNSINKFINKHSSNVTRAFLKNFFEYHNIHDIKITKQTGRKKKREKLFMSEDHYQLIRKRIKRDSDYVYVLLLELSYHCGLRRSECLGIQIDAFNWSIWSTNRGVGLLKIIGKGDKERVVVVPKKVMDNVYGYVKNNMAKIKDGQLFPYTIMLWQNAFKKAIRKHYKNKVDLPNYTLHDLRRARATKWYREGKDIIQIKNRLGHADISTTQLYVTPDAEKELEVWARE